MITRATLTIRETTVLLPTNFSECIMATVESLLSAAKQLGEVQQRKVAALVGAVVAEAAGKRRWL